MNLSIYTYGYLDAMFYVLNGIAMIFSHNFTNSLITFVIFGSCAYYALIIAYTGFSRKEYVIKIFAMVIITNVALNQKTDIQIIDHIHKKRENVSNLPVGFALPVGFIENVGEGITRIFEQAFTGLNNTNYHDYGMVFGSRLISEAKNWRIKTPEFVQNMDNFLRRCVIRDAMIGVNYTVDDLFSTDDMWGLVKTNAGTLRLVTMVKGKTKKDVTCKVAAQEYIEPSFNMETENLLKKKLSSDFSAPGNCNYSERISNTNLSISNFLKTNIETVYSSYLGVNQGAESIIRQQMMINSLHFYGNGYGSVRTNMQQESSWRNIGLAAEENLPMYLALIKGIVYTLFIFVAPMMIISGGGRKYINYLIVVLSLQIWPALCSVLNLFIDLYSSKSLNEIANKIVSFSSFSEIGNYSDKIVSAASGMQILIPILSYPILKGGFDSAANLLAGNISSSVQGAANFAASEVATGNRSVDNVSAGNQQFALRNGFKTDFDTSHISGGATTRHSDGTIERTTSGGNMLLQSGAGVTMSSGSVQERSRISDTSQLNQSLSDTLGLIDSDQRAYNKTERDNETTGANYIRNLAQAVIAGKTINYDELGEMGKATQDMVQDVISKGQGYDYNYVQTKDTGGKFGIDANLGASIGAGGGTIGGVGASAGASAGVGFDKRINAGKINNQTLNDTNNINSDITANKNFSNVVRALSNESFAENNHLDTSFSKDLRANFEKQNQLSKDIAMRSEVAKHYSNALNHIHSVDNSSDFDRYHKIVDATANKYGVSTKDAHDMIEKGDPRVNSVRSSTHYGSNIPARIQAGKASLSHENTNAKLNSFDEQHSHKINRAPISGMTQQAINFGFDVNMNPSANKDRLQEKVDTLINSNDQRINFVKSNIDAKEQARQKKINKAEEDRIWSENFNIPFINKNIHIGAGGETNPSTIQKAKNEKVEG